MSALVDDPSPVQDDDPLGEMQRRLAMRDEQRGPVRHHPTERIVNRGLDPSVDRARRVVEDQDARVIENRARERDPLTLPAREREPALTDRGVISPRQLLDELVCLRGSGSGDDLLVRGVGMSVRDVGAHRIREQEALLEHDSNLPAQ